ncbi:hypothetical protein BDW66DRAFT_166648 [Aspergillus desertorum]
MGSFWSLPSSSPSQRFQQEENAARISRLLRPNGDIDSPPTGDTNPTNAIPEAASTSTSTSPNTTDSHVSPAQPSPGVTPDSRPIDIAIIGGGIIGLITALGLVHRGINVTVYERSHKYTETSAGFSFSSGARKAMEIVSPRVLEALLRVAAPNKHPYIRYFDGFTPEADGAQWQIPADRPDYYGCLRAAFLESLGAEVPEGVVRFRKVLEGYDDDEERGRVLLRFGDGSTAEVDAVIGCDGIKSRTRRIMLGDTHPAAAPGFTEIVAYRAVLPLKGVVAALGEDKAHSHCLSVGPGAYTVSYPIANSPLVNMILFCKRPGPWTNCNKLLETCRRSTAQEAVKAWKPEIRRLVDLLPENPNKWAIFDMSENPAPSYVSASGRVCIAGDAAHASTPFLASGAAMGVEDAAVLATVLDAAAKKLQSQTTTTTTTTTVDKRQAIQAAFRVYSGTRMQRSQRVVTDSRAVGEICMWQDSETGKDPYKCFQAIWESYTRIWEFDVEEMVKRAGSECVRLLG